MDAAASTRTATPARTSRRSAIKSIQAQINKAEWLEATDPAAAATLWTQIDHEDTMQAPWVDMYNPKQIDFLSSNVHGYKWNPQWYILIDQLCLSK